MRMEQKFPANIVIQLLRMSWRQCFQVVKNPISGNYSHASKPMPTESYSDFEKFNAAVLSVEHEALAADWTQETVPNLQQMQMELNSLKRRVTKLEHDK